MIHYDRSKVPIPRPHWLKRRLPTGAAWEKTRALINKGQLHTICQEAKCPNLWECFSQQTAAFLIMGSRCTRNCRFCAVSHGVPELIDPEEAFRVADAVQGMQLRYVVITSVTRDDLPDGGSRFFAETLQQIRKKSPNTVVEVLIPDFQGSVVALRTIVDVHPDVLNHNIETVERLYPSVRPGAVYRRSLELLSWVRENDPTIFTKSGLMLGLGELPEEISKTLGDLLDAGCRILTLGQYLQPSGEQLPVKRFIHPEEFGTWREAALKMGFAEVASGPFVRSSYHARELYHAFQVQPH